MASVKACAPYFYMIVSQFAYAGSSILGKLALGQGLSALVFVVYRHLIAMLILAPLAYVLERFKEHVSLELLRIRYMTTN